MTAAMTYWQQLKHPNWQRKRLQNLEAADWTCQMCGAKENTLHVHHKRYVKGRMAWEYADSELAVLCDQCHLDEHALRDLLDEMLSTASCWAPLQTVVSLIGGYFTASYSIPSSLGERARAAHAPAFTSGAMAHGLGLSSCDRIATFMRETYARIPTEDGEQTVDPAMENEIRLLEARGARLPDDEEPA